jgi:hypothetical protein
MTQASLKELAQATLNGYTTDYSSKVGHTFQKNKRHVWGIFGGWVSADLIDGCYCNHFKYGYNGLNQALNRPLFHVKHNKPFEPFSAIAKNQLIRFNYSGYSNSLY